MPKGRTIEPETKRKASQSKTTTSRQHQMINNELTPGQRFGRLVVIRRNKYFGQYLKKKEYHQFYDMQCDCGNVVTVRKYHLVSHNTQSCGCLLKEYNNSKKKTAHNEQK